MHSLVKAFGLLAPRSKDSPSRLQVINPAPAEYKDLSAFHTRDYLDFVLDSKNASEPDFDDDSQQVEFGLEEVFNTQINPYPYLPFLRIVHPSRSFLLTFA